MSKSVLELLRHMSSVLHLCSRLDMLGAHRIPNSWSCQIAAFPVPSVAVIPEQQEDNIERVEH